jgi:hypothetical protein
MEILHATIFILSKSILLAREYKRYLNPLQNINQIYWKYGSGYQTNKYLKIENLTQFTSISLACKVKIVFTL